MYLMKPEPLSDTEAIIMYRNNHKRLFKYSYFA